MKRITYLLSIGLIISLLGCGATTVTKDTPVPATPTVATTPTPALSIDETLTAMFGDRLVSKSVNPLGPEFSVNAKGVLITFKYAEKNNAKVEHEIAQVVRELAKTGVDIPMIGIWVRSPTGGIQNGSLTYFDRVNIQELAALDDVAMFSRAKEHRTDVNAIP